MKMMLIFLFSLYLQNCTFELGGTENKTILNHHFYLTAPGSVPWNPRNVIWKFSSSEKIMAHIINLWLSELGVV